MARRAAADSLASIYTHTIVNYYCSIQYCEERKKKSETRSQRWEESEPGAESPLQHKPLENLLLVGD